MIFLRLFWEFFKVGLFSIGGGMATLPFLYDLGERSGWFTMAEVADMLAVSESTPGPIGVNMATYVGFRCGGVPGGVVATLGLVAPSILVILLIALALEKFRDNRYVNGAFYTLRPASAALIAAAGWSVLVLVLKNGETYAASGRLAVCSAGRACWSLPFCSGLSMGSRRRKSCIRRCSCCCRLWRVSC